MPKLPINQAKVYLALFSFFVISNGVNCLYYANGTQSIEFAFHGQMKKIKKLMI